MQCNYARALSFLFISILYLSRLSRLSGGLFINSCSQPKRQSSVNKDGRMSRVSPLCLKSAKINFGTLTQRLLQHILSGCQFKIFLQQKKFHPSQANCVILLCNSAFLHYFLRKTFRKKHSPISNMTDQPNDP